MNIKNEVLVRVYIVLSVIVLAAICIFAQAIKISVIEGDRWRAKGKELYVKYVDVEADRGNIITEDGSLLATSLPFFEIRFDPNSTGMQEKDFESNIDSLAFCLATYVDNTYTPGGMAEFLRNERLLGKRNVLIKRKVSYSELKRIREFPLFNKGQYRGGLIVDRRSERHRPFNMLAHRTIGYIRDGAKPVGLEGYFDKYLAGKKGKRLMVRAGKAWIPINDLTEIEPTVGDDILTTLDIDLQDVTETALLRGMQHHNAKHGTAILMEVKTGAIKAIANIGRTEKGWWETYNHAVGSAVEPGSTYKLATIMALLEDGHIKLTDSIDIEKGKHQFYEEEMIDASKESFTIDTTTIQRAFEISSNVGIAKLVQLHYGNREKRAAENFIKRLKSFNLHLPVGIEIDGEAPPYLKEAYSADDDWSGTTLPWMSIGYEVTITPLQMLNLYNAVANDGVMMKPYMVKEIQRYGETLSKIRPTVVNKRIASPKTISEVQSLLEAVVEEGTAHRLKTSQYKFAGKTGTAQTNYKRRSSKKNLKYRASFAGYFPAEDPIYSCLVMITEPSQNGIYGGDVAGPIFREIADNAYASKIALTPAINAYAKAPLTEKKFPSISVGKKDEMAYVLSYLGLPIDKTTKRDWGVLKADSDTLNLYGRTIIEDKVPNVVGMGLRDALYVLENKGLKVVVSGAGKVVNQSIIPGTQIRSQTIRLRLN